MPGKSVQRRNIYAVMAGGNVATLNDGTLLFSTSKAAARKDLMRWVSQWRDGRSRTAIRHGNGSVAFSYTIKHRGCVCCKLTIQNLDTGETVEA